MCFEKQLTIIIPTYNRPERLINQVKSIVNDPDYGKVSLRVTDNHSSYDIKKALKDALTKEQFNSIDLVVRPTNIGLGLNISLPFIECNSRWIWILGDDDRFVGELSQVLADIKTYKDFSFIKYNISNGRRNDEVIVSSIDEFLGYYTDWHPTGDMIFISNALFNLEALESFKQKAIIYNQTLVGHMIPLVAALCDGKATCKFRDYDLVEYQSAPTGTNYVTLWVTMGIANVGDIKFVEDYSKNKRIHELFQWDVKPAIMVDAIMQSRGRGFRYYCYKRIVSVFYSRIGRGRVSCALLFHSSNLFNINFARLIIRDKNKRIALFRKHLKGVALFLQEKNPRLYYKIIRYI